MEVQLQEEINQAILAVSSAYQNAEDGQRTYASDMVVWDFEQISADLEQAAIRLRVAVGIDGEGVREANEASMKAYCIYKAVKRYHVEQCGGHYDEM